MSKIRKAPGMDPGTSAVVERQQQSLKPPPLYQVIMLNDDFTPMEFVVFVIQRFFAKDFDTATEIMLKVHRLGRAVCGVYAKDVASTKVEQVVSAARQAGHPLQCLMESV